MSPGKRKMTPLNLGLGIIVMEAIYIYMDYVWVCRTTLAIWDQPVIKFSFTCKPEIRGAQDNKGQRLYSFSKAFLRYLLFYGERPALLHPAQSASVLQRLSNFSW